MTIAIVRAVTPWSGTYYSAAVVPAECVFLGAGWVVLLCGLKLWPPGVLGLESLGRGFDKTQSPLLLMPGLGLLSRSYKVI